MWLILVSGPTLSEPSIRAAAGPLRATASSEAMRPVYSRPLVGPSLLALGDPAPIKGASLTVVGSVEGAPQWVGVPPRARIPRPRRGLGFTLVYFGIFWGYRPKPCQRHQGVFSRACGPAFILGPAALRFFLFGLRPFSYPWACGPAVLSLWPAAMFLPLGLRPCGCHSRACGPCYYMLNLLKLRFTKNGGFCQNCVMDANVKTTLRVFGEIGKPFYLCNVERISL